jgi:hypothetical protein
MSLSLVAVMVALFLLVDFTILALVFRRAGVFRRVPVEAGVLKEAWIAYVKGSPNYVGVLRDMVPVAIILREQHGIAGTPGFTLYLNDMRGLAEGKGTEMRKVTGCMLSEEEAALIPEETKGFWLARLPESPFLMVRVASRKGSLSAVAGFRAVSALNSRLKAEVRPFQPVVEIYRPGASEVHFLCLLDFPQEHLDVLYDACK